MQSGHHQVADALIDMLKIRTHDMICKKIDLLSYTNQSLEKMISSSYMKWIRFSPETYNLFYKNFFYESNLKNRKFIFYHLLFLRSMEQLLEAEKPDAVVCTHSLPSYLLSQLKLKGKCNIPVINVYTDFFISSVWGREGIDAHFLSSKEVKEILLNHYQIPREKMIVTGIPVHEEIKQTSCKIIHADKPKILVAGGNSGLGSILKLSHELKESEDFDFYILCGNNRKLYKEVQCWNLAHIKPLPYISSRSEMNRLYDEVDAIITKPGGVTMSEVLRKRLPTFVHSFLPGQEEINLTYLKERQLVFELDLNASLQQQLLAVLKNHYKMRQWEKALNIYLQGLEVETPDKLVEILTSIIEKCQSSFSFNYVHPSSQSQ